MGDVNQVIFLKSKLPEVAGPVLEIGSKDYGNTSSFRDAYGMNEYVGVDLEAGKGVDVVQDLTIGTGSLPLQHFELVVCCSVLEHVKKPWVMAETLTSLLRPGGKIYISVPWVWRYHPYPDDYFRISWRGIIELFPKVAWGEAYYSTNVPGEFWRIDPKNPGIDNANAAHAETPNGTRKYLPYLNTNMIGAKRIG